MGVAWIPGWWSMGEGKRERRKERKCHNTYGYSLLFYKVYIRRENADSWNSGLEKEQILETYSAQLQKS